MSFSTSGENNGMFGRRHSEDSRQLMRENRKSTEGENNPMFGKKHSSETKAKLSLAALIRIYSWREKCTLW